MASGLAAFVYVAALWYIAPAFVREGAGIADRLRMVIVLGVAIPGTLALLHLLYGPLVWVVIALAVLWRLRKRAPEIPHDAALYATLAGVVVVAWPPLVRPPLDGDTLLYHLPNAVAFVQSHSLWIARTPYWFYPPGSELFASGIVAAGGRWSLPLAGILPALLVAARLFTVARSAGASAFAAAGIPLAFVCTPVSALQTGTLENDVWLAAFFVEALVADRSPVSLGVCALLKPYGWIEAIVAAAAARVSWRVLATALLPLALWVVRDVVLLAGGARFGVYAPPYTATVIAWHVPSAVFQLAHGIAAVTPAAFVWFAALAAAAFFTQTRGYAAAGLAALILYAFLPFSYGDGISTSYVLNASSLRFALPALAAGALAGAVLMPRMQPAGALLAYAVAAWGASSVLAAFRSDLYTQWAPLAAAVAFAAALFVKRTRGFSAAAAAFALVLVGSWSASSRAAGFYADWMPAPSGKPTGVFAWLSRRQPERVVAANVRTGAVLMSSPTTWTQAASAEDGCDRARRAHALFLIGSNESLRGADLARAVARSRSCGSVVYEDGAAVVIQVP